MRLQALAGGKVDNIIMRVMDIFLSIPSMVMAIAIVSALGTSTFNLLLSIAVPQMPPIGTYCPGTGYDCKRKGFYRSEQSCRSWGYADHFTIHYS